MESVTVVTEPLLHPHFVQFEIVAPLLQRLRGRYDITVAAPRIAPLVQRELEAMGIQAADGGAYFPPLRRSRDEIPSYVGSWLRDSFWGWNRRAIERVLNGSEGIRINISMTTAIDCDVWMIQSRPMGMALDAMRHGVTGPLKVALTAANPFVGAVDEHHVLDVGRRARTRYATTQHVADWFGSKGLPIERVLPVYYRSAIHQSAARPSRDYILVYVGKETDSTAVRMLLDTGLPITMFGSKSAGWVMKRLQLHRYPNAHLLGYVTDPELCDLYSNARFVAFPFTEEPFGLIPLESMACGTPILTYNDQGPAESVLDGQTGWLVRSPEEFARRAVELWNAGSPTKTMIDACLARARRYHLDTIEAGWRTMFERAFALSREVGPKGRRGPWGRPAPIAVAPFAGGTGPRSSPLPVPPSGSPISAGTVRPSLLIVDSTSVEGVANETPSSFWRSGGYPGRIALEEPARASPERVDLDEDEESGPDDLTGPSVGSAPSLPHARLRPEGSTSTPAEASTAPI